MLRNIFFFKFKSCNCMMIVYRKSKFQYCNGLMNFFDIFRRSNTIQNETAILGTSFFSAAHTPLTTRQVYIYIRLRTARISIGKLFNFLLTL